MAGGTLSRQPPTVGAGCLNWASPDLCGGRPERDVPTAIAAAAAIPADRGDIHRRSRSLSDSNRIIEQTHAAVEYAEQQSAREAGDMMTVFNFYDGLELVKTRVKTCAVGNVR